MILYHGSSVPVPMPDPAHSRKAVDFGPGFYLTPIRSQALRWCDRFTRLGRDGVLNSYELDEARLCEFRVMRFETYSEEWLRHISSCRLGNDSLPFDLVIGGVADDKVFNTCELFFEGRITEEEALDRLRFERPNAQYCLKTQVAIDALLRYVGSESA